MLDLTWTHVSLVSHLVVAAVNYCRQQMMGAEAMGIVTVNLHFTDEKVCKNYLCGTCPHIVFTNTVRPFLCGCNALLK